MATKKDKKAKSSTKKKGTKVSKTLEQELHDLNDNIAKQNYYFSRSQVVIRGLINGLFTALGATIGLTIVLFLLASLLRTVSAVPFINDILEQTGVNKIIEYQIQQIEEEGPTTLPQTGDEPTPTEKITTTPTPVPTKSSQATPEPTTRFELTDEY